MGVNSMGVNSMGGAQNPVKVIAVTSGKGGVGKTNVSVNLAVSLARTGHSVVLMDADLGLANVDVMLGLHAKHNISHVLNGEKSLDDILMVGPAGIKVIPATSGVKRMAELSPVENAGLIRSFAELQTPVDIMIVDVAAGISDSVLSFGRAAHEVVVVVCDEPSSITDAYALIKVLSRDYGVERFHVLANMVESEAHGRILFKKIAIVSERFLDVTLDYLGTVPFDTQLRKAIQRQNAVCEFSPNSPSA
ncbi:MAG: MinD/ParA family protein, partial [Thiotrichales bacterium]|nr:MinD/ParA family protein [Thiotrichales bacterium]